MRPRDTTRAADEVQTAVYRRMSAAQRIAIAVSMSEDARDLARAGIRSRHPTYRDRDVEQALRRLLYGDDLVRRAWPDLPLVDP